MFDHFDGNKILWDKIFLHGNLSRLLDMRDTWIIQREQNVLKYVKFVAYCLNKDKFVDTVL